MFWIALAAAAGAAHSLVGAFGFVLGEVPGAKVASCERNDYPSKTEMFVCPGDAFFSQVYVHTQRKQVTILSGARRYKGTDTKPALRACMDDLWALERTLDEKYPSLLPARTMKGYSFKISESLWHEYAEGRTIEGKCQEASSIPNNMGDSSVILWLTYTLSTGEASKLNRLDDADRLIEKGLKPEKL